MLGRILVFLGGLLVVDEAQLLPEDSFEVLRLLLNFQVDGAPALALGPGAPA